jgi:hypothetical protein
MGLLTSAKALAPSKTSAPKAGAKHEFELVDLESYAQVDAVIKACEGLKKTLGTEINVAAMDEFYRLGQNGVCPESFTGTEGNASASIELRKRSTASVLTDDEVAELTKLSIPVETVVTQMAMFGIDPKYAENMELLTKVEQALAGLVPEDFFFKQDQVSKQVVSDQTIAVAFAKKAPKHVIKMITTQAIKAKLAFTNLADLLLAIKPMLTDETEAEAATKARAK